MRNNFNRRFRRWKTKRVDGEGRNRSVCDSGDGVDGSPEEGKVGKDRERCLGKSTIFAYERIDWLLEDVAEETNG